MAAADLLQRLLAAPDPDDLWRLHPLLLDWQDPRADAARDLAESFYTYLCVVRNKLTSLQYNEFAVALSAGAAGMAAVSETLESLREAPDQLFGNVLLGSLSGALETLAAYQYVKAWGTDYLSAHEQAAWALYTALWRLSAGLRPNLDTAARAALVESLLAPVRDLDLPDSVRAAMVVRLFQLLLAIALLPLLDAPSAVQPPLVSEG
ncbi:hypothetical protein [Aggregatilinea lenta]|uniref:hypothetical protein n=1 Tax=Aggregatilinea lenta TaxID=913108 RepID=UPI000E5C4B03|nr:hypothetical protein [Aggregatilinea lenta]